MDADGRIKRAKRVYTSTTMDADGRIEWAKRVCKDTRTVELNLEHALGPPVFVFRPIPG